MKKFLTRLLLSVCLAGTAAAAPGLDSPQPIGAYLNGVFPTTTPGPSGTWGITDAFPNLTFVDPVKMVKDPLSEEHVYIVCRNGEIWHIPFSPSATSAQKVRFLDRRANTWGYWDTGMLSIAFHPDFGKPGDPNRGYVYVFYQYVPQQPVNQTTGSPSYMRVSRFTLADGATSIDPSTEYVMIQQYDRDNWHSGGQMFFAPDGFLHIVIGDEGAANDSHGVSQKINERLFGGILRIDVNRDPVKSHPIRRQPTQVSMPSGWAQSFTQGYYIPNDNPWLDPNGSILEEFWSVGTRSPYSMHFDKATGDIWIAEVGQGTREEITIAKRGGNHQWPYREGLANGPKAKPANLIGTDNPPVYDYGRSMGGCIIGGMVYRGSQHSGSLTGKFLFGDHNTRAIYALNRPEGGEPFAEYLTSVPRSGGTKRGLSGICEGPDGEVYLTELGDTGTDTGKIYKLVRTGGAIADPPPLLSQTGAFTDLATLTPRSGLIPFGVNSPLWTDGSEKQRWIALPNDGTHDTAAERITYNEIGAWEFPKGTVLVKHFALPVDERNPSLVKPVETRFFVHGSDGTWYGVTYKWNDAGTDATLMTTGGTRDFTITRQDGSTATQRWSFPSRSDCRTCHSSSSDNVLGVRSHQLAGDYHYSLTGRTANQLETWNALGMFGTSFGNRNPEQLPRAVDPHDPHASLDQRVKSYLDANCSHCHQPGGVTANFDARFSVPLFAQGIVGGLINRPVNSPADKVVDPGNLANSLMHGRASVVGANQMPPLGKNVVDEKAVALLADWIRSLSAESFAASSTLGIRADYYNGRNFDTPVLSRVDPQVNFDWELGSPGAGIASDSFSVRWTGKLVAPSTGTYTLYGSTDDGFRLKINGATLIDAWYDQPPTEHTATVNLVSGQPVDIVVEFYEAEGGALASLSWSGPGVSKTVVPASAYRLSESFNHLPVAGNDAFSITRNDFSSLDILTNDSDADAPPGIHGVAITQPPLHGTIRIDGTAKRLVYTPDPSATATTDAFSYTLTDPQGDTSAPATVTLAIPLSFTEWSARAPGAGGSASSNTDGDLFTDLLEFALGGDPASGAFPSGTPLSLDENAGAISFSARRPAHLTGITYEILLGDDLTGWAAGPSPQIVSTGDGWETVTFPDLQTSPGVSADLGFARLKVTSGASFSITLPFGWLAQTFPAGSRTLGVPFREPPVFSSAVTATDGAVLSVNGTPPSGPGYVEVVSGPLAGSHFDIASTAAGSITLASTPPDLTGASIALSRHHTLGGTFDKNRFTGSTNPSSADQVQFYVNDGTDTGRFELYYLLDARPGNSTHQWRAFLPGGGDQTGRVISPGEGVFVKRPAGVPTARIVLRGQVRANPFRHPLQRGVNLAASPFPLDLSPRQRGLLDPVAGFKASTNLNAADQFQLHQNGAFRVFYLLDHPTLPDPWRETVPGSPDYSDVPLLRAAEAVFLKRDQPSSSYQIPLPWNP